MSMGSIKIQSQWVHDRRAFLSKKVSRYQKKVNYLKQKVLKVNEKFTHFQESKSTDLLAEWGVVIDLTKPVPVEEEKTGQQQPSFNLNSTELNDSRVKIVIASEDEFLEPEDSAKLTSQACSQIGDSRNTSRRKMRDLEDKGKATDVKRGAQAKDTEETKKSPSISKPTEAPKNDERTKPNEESGPGSNATLSYRQKRALEKQKQKEDQKINESASKTEAQKKSPSKRNEQQSVPKSEDCSTSKDSAQLKQGKEPGQIEKPVKSMKSENAAKNVVGKIKEAKLKFEFNENPKPLLKKVEIPQQKADAVRQSRLVMSKVKKVKKEPPKTKQAHFSKIDNIIQSDMTAPKNIDDIMQDVKFISFKDITEADKSQQFVKTKNRRKQEAWIIKQISEQDESKQNNGFGQKPSQVKDEKSADTRQSKAIRQEETKQKQVSPVSDQNASNKEDSSSKLNERLEQRRKRKQDKSQDSIEQPQSKSPNKKPANEQLKGQSKLSNKGDQTPKSSTQQTKANKVSECPTTPQTRASCPTQATSNKKETARSRTDPNSRLELTQEATTKYLSMAMAHTYMNNEMKDKALLLQQLQAREAKKGGPKRKLYINENRTTSPGAKIEQRKQIYTGTSPMLKNRPVA